MGQAAGTGGLEGGTVLDVMILSVSSVIVHSLLTRIRGPVDC